MASFGGFFSGALSYVASSAVVGAIFSAVKWYSMGKKGTNSVLTIPDTGLFDEILLQFANLCYGPLDHNVYIYSQGLFGRLITLDFVIAIILGLMAFENGPNFISLFMNKIFKYGFWMYCIMHWRTWNSDIVNSLSAIGRFSGDIPKNIVTQPSWIINKGFSYGLEYFQFIFQNSSIWEMEFMFKMVVALIAGLFIFAAFFLMALNCFLTMVEFYLSSALMLIFVPFAVFEKTERYASQVFNLVVSCGIRMMVLTALLSIADPLFATGSKLKSLFVYKDSPNILAALLCMGIVLTFTYLCCEIPQVASGIASGGLRLDSNNALMHAAGASYALQKGLGTAINAGATVTGALDRGISSARAASGAIGSTAAGISGFAKGINAGITQSTVGGLEEGKAVYGAASGRHTGLETIGSDGKPSTQASITRDADGNIISAPQSVRQAMKSQADGNQENSSSNSSGNQGGSSSGGSSSGKNNGENSSYVPAPMQKMLDGISKDGPKGQHGDFSH